MSVVRSAYVCLGIADGHGAAAALSIDGVLVGNLQEERKTKLKNQTGFPKLAIERLRGIL